MVGRDLRARRLQRNATGASGVPALPEVGFNGSARPSVFRPMITMKGLLADNRLANSMRAVH